MVDEVIECNVCRQPITNPAERIPRAYVIKKLQKQIGKQYKHDACNDAYAKEKTGLEEIRSQ